MQASPRGYIFSGLELINKPLIEFIYKTLSIRSKFWRNKYIVQKLNNPKSKFNLPLVGEKNDLYKYLDELQCFKIIIMNEDIFKPLINIKLVKELKNIRNNCAHKFRKGETIQIPYADNALQKMLCVIQDMDKECYSKLRKLRKSLYKQNYDDKIVLVGKSDLINFLEKEIWMPSIKKLEVKQDISLEYKNLLKRNMESVLRIVQKIDDPEDIAEWFMKHLLSPEGIKTYLEYRELGLITFEDKRLEFIKKCYGE
jgi:hypothetical protein